jgi:hypothetical protein
MMHYETPLQFIMQKQTNHSILCPLDSSIQVFDLICTTNARDFCFFRGEAIGRASSSWILPILSCGEEDGDTGDGLPPLRRWRPCSSSPLFEVVWSLFVFALPQLFLLTSLSRVVGWAVSCQRKMNYLLLPLITEP